MSQDRPTYKTDATEKLQLSFAKTFGLPIDQVWIDAVCNRQVKEGKRLQKHNLKFTLSVPDTQSIGLLVRLSIAEYDWSIFHTCSLDYSKHSQTLQIEFEVDYDFAKLF
jgi:hypothetical protein